LFLIAWKFLGSFLEVSWKFLGSFLEVSWKFLRKDKGSNFLLNEILSLHENSFTFASRALLLPAV
jgi:hypothetical protein